MILEPEFEVDRSAVRIGAGIFERRSQGGFVTLKQIERGLIVEGQHQDGLTGLLNGETAFNATKFRRIKTDVELRSAFCVAGCNFCERVLCRLSDIITGGGRRRRLKGGSPRLARWARGVRPRSRLYVGCIL